MSEFHPFKDMKENAKAQHEVDKANFQAAKAEAAANFEEAKSSSSARQAVQQQKREKQIAEAEARTEAAQDRIKKAKSARE